MADVRRFNPGQPRVPGGEHGGQWVASASAGITKGRRGQHAWASESVDVGGHQVDFNVIHNPKLTWGDERQVQLAVHGPGGRHDIALSADDVFNVGRGLHDRPVRIGRQKSLIDDEGDAGTRYSRTFVGLTRTGDDTYELDLATGNGTRPPETVALISANGADLDRLSGAAVRAGSADSLDTQAGPVGLRGLKNGRWSLSLPADSGEPVALTLDRADLVDVATELKTALNTLNQHVPGDGDSPSRPRVFAPDEIVGQAQLPQTMLYFDVTGSRGDGVFHLHSTAHNWALNLTDAQVARLVDMLHDANSGTSAADLTRATSRSDVRRYDPAQKRDPDGKWGDGIPGPSVFDFADELGIDDEIPLDPGDLLGSNGVVSDREGDADLKWAVVFSAEYGPEVRLGVVDAEHSLSWKADWETEPTAILDTETTSKLRKNLTSGAAQADQAAKEADKAWRAGSAPTDPKLNGSEPLLTGEAIGGGDTADVAWEFWLTDDDPTSWRLEVRTDPDSDGIRFDPKGTQDLLRELDKIEGELRGPIPTEDARSAEPVDDETAEWEEGIEALVTALSELSDEVRAGAFDEAKHPRGPGGKFRSTVDKLKSAIEVHRAGGGKGDPFEGFDREQLRRAAKTRGITLGRGEDRDSIAKKLLEDLGGKPAPAKVAPVKAVKAAAEKPEVQRPARKPRKLAAKKASPKAAETPSRSQRGVAGNGRDRVEDVIAEVGRGDDRHDRLQAEYGQYDVRDGVLTQLVRDQGWGLPATSSVDDAVAHGGIELWRGTRSHESGITAEEQFAAMRDDPDFAFGNGFYGNGIYFSVEKRVADEFAGFNSPGADQGAADTFGKGAVVRVALRPDAKVIGMKKLEAERKKWMAENRSRLSGKAEDWMFDNGKWAAMRGYDVIQVDGLDDGSRIHPPGGGKSRQSKARQYIVLNRGALTMEAG